MRFILACAFGYLLFPFAVIADLVFSTFEHTKCVFRVMDKIEGKK